MPKSSGGTEIAAKMLSTGSANGGGRKSRGATRAQQIVRIAQELFYEHGYASTSMDDIAQSVGILKGSLYYYVNSKEDLLFHVVESVHDTVTDLLGQATARDDLTPLDRVVEYVRLQLHHNAQNITELAVYHHDWRSLDGERLKTIEKRRHENEAVIIDLLEQAIALGEVESGTDTRLALAHTFAVTIWPYTWYRSTSKISATKLADSGAEFVRKALTAAS